MYNICLLLHGHKDRCNILSELWYLCCCFNLNTFQYKLWVSSATPHGHLLHRVVCWESWVHWPISFSWKLWNSWKLRAATVYLWTSSTLSSETEPRSRRERPRVTWIDSSVEWTSSNCPFEDVVDNFLVKRQTQESAANCLNKLRSITSTSDPRARVPVSGQGTKRPNASWSFWAFQN